MATTGLLNWFRRDKGRKATATPALAVPERAPTPQEAMVDRYVAEASADRQYWRIKPAAFESGAAILDANSRTQIDCLIVALEGICIRRPGEVTTAQASFAMRALVAVLLRRKQPFTEGDFQRMIEITLRRNLTWYGHNPIVAVVRALVSWVGDRPLPAELRPALEGVRQLYAGVDAGKDVRDTIERVERLLGIAPPNSVRIEPRDAWGVQASSLLEGLDAGERDRWSTLLTHAVTATTTRPTKPWRKKAAERIELIGEETAVAAIERLLGLLRVVHKPDPSDADRALPQAPTTHNANMLRGLVWSAELIARPELGVVLADTAEVCFKKIPNSGPRAAKVGNACVTSLGALPGRDGAAHLQRIIQRIDNRAARTLIDGEINKIARREGVSREELDDLAVPTFGLVDGRRRVEFGAFVAEIVVRSTAHVDLNWFSADGKPRRSEPAEIKRDHAAELTAIKKSVADLRKSLLAQRDRIERLLLNERSWPLADWQRLYLDHPLLSMIARRLIWSFQTNGERRLGAWLDGVLVDIDDRPLDGLTGETRVQLWHPIADGEATVVGWQRWLERHQIQQPFKQAHREVYLLTDAERTTATYSNRFAAHILRQHQMNALCRDRGWSYQLQGGFDSSSRPTIDLPRHNLIVEFWVDAVDNLDDETRIVATYVATDAVRFRRRNGFGAPDLPLDEVPPLVFSELMRDVDLFVGVCSVGNDPNWQDQGPERFRTYWENYSFGALSASAVTRRQVLERLLPRLAIGDRCELEDRFLQVRGDLRTYRIHLGSGNIMMVPDNQYLCIVPGRKQLDGSEQVFLPFEGDNQLYIILSKAFLLANDTAITDPTITRQINRR